MSEGIPSPAVFFLNAQVMAGSVLVHSVKDPFHQRFWKYEQTSFLYTVIWGIQVLLRN